MIITFSNRCFPSKAVAIWRALGGDDQARLIDLYLRHAGFPTVEAYAVVPEGDLSDPLWAGSVERDEQRTTDSATRVMRNHTAVSDGVVLQPRTALSAHRFSDGKSTFATSIKRP